MRNLFLLLALIVAGVQSASADNIYEYERDTVIMNGVYYETNFLVNNYYFLGSNNYYNASIIHLLTAGTSLSVPSEITIDSKAYKVRSVGKHTYLKGYPTRYFFDSSVPTNPGWRSEWKDDTGYHFGPDGALDTDVEYSAVPVYNSNSGLKNLTFQGGIEIYGPFTSNSLETLNFQGDATIKGDMLVVGLRNLNLNGALDISGTLTSDRLTEIHFNNLTCSGKFECSSLTDVYFPALKNEWVLFSGNVFTGVSFSGSQWEDHFPSSLKKKIRAHVWDLTSEQLAKLKNSAIWCDFKEIVNHKSNVNYTITSDGNARIDFVELKGNASYVSATGISQIAFTSSGSKSGSVKSGGNYAVEIRDVDFDTKNVQLLRNGSVATLEPYEDQGQPLRYHEDLDLQQNVSYEVSVSDKVCTVSFAQTGYTGRIMYQKTWNGTTSTGVITAYAPTVTCAQGSQLKLTIPYDQYTPNVLRLNGSTVSMTKANGEATATITVPAAATAEVDLTWQAPQQTYETHQPQIMIMRSGEGQVVFKGAAFLSSEWQQYIDDYEQSGLIIDERDEGSWVISGNGPVNCSQTVNTVTAPDVDPSGDTLDESSWGFIVEMTPVAGQKLKTFLIGQISGGEELLWDDMLFGDYSESNYITYNESTNTYTFDLRGDYMNYAAGDYVVNIVMGPEETAVETGKTLNFVRQGGRGDSFIEWYDESGRDFYFEEGSTSKTIPNEELQDDDLKMYIDIEEGEVLHVYKNGADITSQFQLNGQSTTQYWAPLEEESATYTLLIDDAPDANPTWSIHNATEGDVVVEQTLKDGTTTTTTFTENFNELVIDDSSVSKVSLKVYLNTADISSSLRVECNGVDVTYQSTSVEGDSNGNWVTYEVPADQLIDATWNISNNTDRAQTFIVTGGTTEQVVEMAYEYLYNEPTLHAKNDGVPVTAYLPPYDSDKNKQVNLTLYVKNEERVTVLRNGVDVTSAFTKHDGYYEIDATDGNYPNLDTREALGFQINDPAVWKITVRSLTDQIKTINIANPDGMDITYTRNYKDGQTIDESISEAYRQIFFDDSDRENTSSVYLKVPIDEGRPVRVLCDGVDVSCQFTECDYNLGCLIYEASLTQNQTWNISYETSHRQTFIRKGGTKSWNVEVVFDYPEGYEKCLNPDAVGTPLYVDFPTYDSTNSSYAYIDIDVEEGSSFTVLRNGVDVTDKFTLVTGSAGASAGFERYCLDESDYDVNNDGMTPGLGFTFRDPAVWQITIGDTDRYDVNRDGKISIADVTKLVNRILGKE